MARNPVFVNTEESTDRRSVFHNERDKNNEYRSFIYRDERISRFTF